MAMAENRKPTRSKVKESGRRAVVEASRLADEGRAIAERAGVVGRERGRRKRARRGRIAPKPRPPMRVAIR